MVYEQCDGREEHSAAIHDAILIKVGLAYILTADLPLLYMCTKLFDCPDVVSALILSSIAYTCLHA